MQFLFYSSNCPNGDCRTFGLFEFFKYKRFPKTKSKGETSGHEASQGNASDAELKEDKVAEAEVEGGMPADPDNSSVEQAAEEDGSESKDSKTSPTKSNRLLFSMRFCFRDCS